MAKRSAFHSLTLSLDGDFIERLAALTGSRDLRDDDFRAVLEAGLSAMEEGAAEQGLNRCVRSNPAVVAEFEALKGQLHELAAKADMGEVREYTVTMMVAEPGLTFMAWLDRLVMAQKRGGFVPVGTDIDMDRPADFAGAVRYMEYLLEMGVDQDWWDFVAGRHRLLRPPKSADGEDQSLH